MRKEIRAFLKTIRILPIDKKHWHIFNINHTRPNKDERKKIKKMIVGKVRDLNGIYIYKDKSNKVLYVGKTNPLRNRLYSHYLESFEPVPGDTKDMKWHRFFSRYKGKLRVYWRKVNGERERKLIEQMLEYILCPKFIEFK